VDPQAQEQVSLGRFVAIEATEKEKRKILRQISREQRKGRLIGVELEDLGQWDTWLSAPLRNKEGKPAPGTAAFEPEKYTIELSVAERDLKLHGKARLDLRPILPGSRAVNLRLNNDLQVVKVTDTAGAELFVQRSGRDLTVFLPAAPAEDAKAGIVVEYAGNLIDREGSSFALRDTTEWYPHAGTVDRARYDVTFRWPKKLDLLAAGQKVEGGEGKDGTLWERRVLEVPSGWFSFEVGKLKLETAQAGHVRLTLAFDPTVQNMGKETREEITKTVADSLVYFEELFGPYPLDELTVVTVPRGFSQATLGFVTLSSLMMLDLDAWNVYFGLEDRRTVIAHEIAHQWWAHAVGWASYRDQWISEAMANYSALLYARKRLDWAGRYGLGPTAGWQEALTATTPDGRPIESVGPVVLGERLFSSRAGDAYQAIVYHKGAVILDMLARTLGEENFPKILKQVVKVVANRAISTGDFLSLIERITTTELDWFADQFVYGTGLPEVYYRYAFEPKADGKWAVKIEARQQTPYRFRYRVVKSERGGHDVTREKLDQIQVEASSLVVPVEITVFDPARVEGGRRGKEKVANATVKGHTLLKGERTDLTIDVDHEPQRVWLDRNAVVFGRFFDESRHPKRVLFFQGIDAAAAGKHAEAEALYEKALAAEVETGSEEEKRDLKRQERLWNAQIELGRARLFLDQARDADAAAALDRAERVLGSYQGWVFEELKVLTSRIELRRGEYEKAFRRLRKGLLRAGQLDSTEGYVLLAIAARATGHADELAEATRKARENGADLSQLESAAALPAIRK
ncbi:MAG TPA: M1 family aminopeptidase, partial [Thermoanaerobaculia bacterium]|nr:M1 family aminopeptidase [Thermoanaerobaculia bacterium]